MTASEGAPPRGGGKRPVGEGAGAAGRDGTWRGTETVVVFALEEREAGGGGRPAGVAGLNDIDLLHRRSTLGIVIGEPAARGRGVGTEAVGLLLDYGFTVLALHNILLTVFAFNPAGIRCYEKAGFKVIGRRREARLQAGVWHDEVLMDALASEFVSPVLAKKFLPK